VRVLIAGLGSIGGKHLAALKKIDPGAEVYALRSGRDDAAVEGVVNIFDVSAAVALDPDFIIIASPTYLHAQHMKELLPLGRPMLIEKPLAHNLDVEALLPELQSVKTYVACNLRFLHALQFIKEKYCDNKDHRINEVNVYCGSYLPDWRPGQDFRKNYSSDGSKGGGVHLDLIHELDYLYWFFGAPQGVLSLKKSASSLQINAIDSAHYILDYEGFTAAVVLNYYRRDPKRVVEIVTGSTTVKADLLKNEVFENGVSVFRSSQVMMDTYVDQLKYFIAHLNNRNGFNDINEALAVLKICLA